MIIKLGGREGGGDVHNDSSSWEGGREGGREEVMYV